MRQFRRADRVAEQMLRLISEMLEQELHEHVPGMVTFTRVDLSSDLRYARVYFSHLGSEEDRARALAYFEQEQKRIRHQVGSRLSLRHMPELTFRYDPSVAEGVRIEQLLNEIRSDKDE